MDIHGFDSIGLPQPSVMQSRPLLISQMAGNANGTREIFNDGRVVDTPVGATGLPTLSVYRPLLANNAARVPQVGWNFIATGTWTGATELSIPALRIHTRRGILTIPRDLEFTTTLGNRLTATQVASDFTELTVAVAANGGVESRMRVNPKVAGDGLFVYIEYVRGNTTALWVGAAVSNSRSSKLISGPTQLLPSGVYLTSSVLTTTMSASLLTFNGSPTVVDLYPTTNYTLGDSVRVRGLTLFRTLPDRPALLRTLTTGEGGYGSYCRVFLNQTDLV